MTASAAGSSTGAHGSSGTTAGFTSTGTGTGGRASSSGVTSTGAASSTGGSTGGSSGSSSGGSGTGRQGSSSGGAVCLATISELGGDPCGPDEECASSYVCASDPFLGQFCLLTCLQDGDCTALATVCVDGTCQTNLCGPGTSNGAYNEVCNASGTRDGTCVPYYVQTAAVVIGLCVQGGTSTTCCGPCTDRQHLDTTCASGMVCHEGSCGAACDPGVIGCAAGADCTYVSTEPPAGICSSPIPPTCP